MDTHAENREIRAAFSRLNNPLPCEIVTKILDDAEKWHCTFVDSREPTTSPLIIHSTPATGYRSIVRSPPLSARDASVLRKVTFRMTSKDQGWSGYAQDQGTHRGSWTWFDAIVHPHQDAVEEQPEPQSHHEHQQRPQYESQYPRRYYLQDNVHAGKSMESYCVNWKREEGHELFKVLLEGDTINLMACAKYPGWHNDIEAASMECWSADTGE